MAHFILMSHGYICVSCQLSCYVTWAADVDCQVWQYSGVQLVMSASRSTFFKVTTRRRSAAHCRSAWVPVWQQWTSFSVSLMQLSRASSLQSQLVPNRTRLPLPPHSAKS